MAKKAPTQSEQLTVTQAIETTLYLTNLQQIPTVGRSLREELENVDADIAQGVRYFFENLDADIAASTLIEAVDMVNSRRSTAEGNDDKRFPASAVGEAARDMEDKPAKKKRTAKRKSAKKKAAKKKAAKKRRGAVVGRTIEQLGGGKVRETTIYSDGSKDVVEKKVKGGKKKAGKKKAGKKKGGKKKSSKASNGRKDPGRKPKRDIALALQSHLTARGRVWTKVSSLSRGLDGGPTPRRSIDKAIKKLRGEGLVELQVTIDGGDEVRISTKKGGK